MARSIAKTEAPTALTEAEASIREIGFEDVERIEVDGEECALVMIAGRTGCLDLLSQFGRRHNWRN